MSQAGAEGVPELEQTVTAITPRPVPFSFQFDRMSKPVVIDGQEIALVRLSFMDHTGSKVLYLPAPEALKLADNLRGVAAGGLTIAQSLDDLGGEPR